MEGGREEQNGRDGGQLSDSCIGAQVQGCAPAKTFRKKLHSSWNVTSDEVLTNPPQTAEQP